MSYGLFTLCVSLSIFYCGYLHILCYCVSTIIFDAITHINDFQLNLPRGRYDPFSPRCASLKDLIIDILLITSKSTANIAEEVVDSVSRHLKMGIYYGECSIGDTGVKYPMVMSLGLNPTYHNSKMSLVYFRPVPPTNTSFTSLLTFLSC